MFFVFLTTATLAYLALVEITKTIFYRVQGGAGRRVQPPSGQSNSILEMR